MNLKFLKKMLAVLAIMAMSLAAMTACSKKNKDEGGKGDLTSDGTDGSAADSQNEEDLPGTDTSDATGEGNEVEGDDTEATTVDAEVITDAQMRELVETELGKTAESIYNSTYQDAAENQLEILKMKDNYNLDNPLFVINPYGTNRLSMYAYLNTEEDAFLEYTISVDEQIVYDFTRHLYSKDSEAEGEHEGQMIGLVPGVTNTITIRSYDGDNKITDKYVYKIDMPKSDTIEQTILDVTQEESLEELSDGLFALFETSANQEKMAGHILFYDNAGIVRSEIPLDGINANSRIEFVDDNILYACSDNQFALVNGDGKAEYIYTLDGFTLHHDFDYDEDEDCIVALATNKSLKTSEDSIVLLNLETADYNELFNFTQLLPEVSNGSVNSATDPASDGLGWIQLNSIQIMDSDSIIVGSRELNSIIKVDKIRENPEIVYIISDPVFWEGSSYAPLLLEQTGSFTNHTGQYNVTYLKDDTLEDGQYYLHIYNSNYGSSEAHPEFDYTTIQGVGTTDQPAEYSYYYRYLVDEKAKTYELKDSFPVPYSNSMGSTQEVDGNRVVCSGTAGLFGEYDKDGNLIAEYGVRVPEGAQLYRVFKYKMDGYWFN